MKIFFLEISFRIWWRSNFKNSKTRIPCLKVRFYFDFKKIHCSDEILNRHYHYISFTTHSHSTNVSSILKLHSKISIRFQILEFKTKHLSNLDHYNLQNVESLKKKKKIPYRQPSTIRKPYKLQISSRSYSIKRSHKHTANFQNPSVRTYAWVCTDELHTRCRG